MVKKGDKVTTIYGEELTVLDVKTLDEKRKKGKVIQEPQTSFLAQSGDHKVWVPIENIKKGTK